MAEISLRLEARITLLRTGIALERHRLEKGGLPGDLNALIPGYLEATPRDPFDRQPLR